MYFETVFFGHWYCMSTFTWWLREVIKWFTVWVLGVFVFQDHCHVWGLLHWWETILIPLRPHWLLQLRVVPTERWKAAITSGSTRGNAAVSASIDCATGNASLMHHKSYLPLFLFTKLYQYVIKHTATLGLVWRNIFLAIFLPGHCCRVLRLSWQLCMKGLSFSRFKLKLGMCVYFTQPVEDRRRVRAILPYTKVPDTDEIRYISWILMGSHIAT